MCTSYARYVVHVIDIHGCWYVSCFQHLSLSARSRRQSELCRNSENKNMPLFTPYLSPQKNRLPFCQWHILSQINMCTMYRSTCTFGPSLARQAHSLSTKSGRHPVVAVLFQNIDYPVLNGVQKPRKPGGG